MRGNSTQFTMLGTNASITTSKRERSLSSRAKEATQKVTRPRKSKKVDPKTTGMPHSPVDLLPPGVQQHSALLNNTTVIVPPAPTIITTAHGGGDSDSEDGDSFVLNDLSLEKLHELNERTTANRPTFQSQNLDHDDNDDGDEVYHSTAENGSCDDDDDDDGSHISEITYPAPNRNFHGEGITLQFTTTPSRSLDAATTETEVVAVPADAHVQLTSDELEAQLVDSLRAKFENVIDGKGLWEVIYEAPKRNKKPSLSGIINVVIKRLLELKKIQKLEKSMSKVGGKKRREYIEKVQEIVCAADEELVNDLLKDVLAEVGGGTNTADRPGLCKAALIAFALADPANYGRFEQLSELAKPSNRLQNLNLPGGPPDVEKQIYNELAEHANSMKSGYSMREILTAEHLGSEEVVKALRGVDPAKSPIVTGTEIQEFRTKMGNEVSGLKKRAGVSGQHESGPGRRLEVFQMFINVTHKGANSVVNLMSEGAGKVKDLKLYICFLVWEDNPCDWTTTSLGNEVRASTEQAPQSSQSKYAEKKSKKEAKRMQAIQADTERLAAIFDKVVASKRAPVSTPVGSSSSSSLHSAPQATSTPSINWKDKYLEQKFKSQRMETIAKALNGNLITDENREKLTKEYNDLAMN